jgi:hypothetical protein
VFVRRFHVCGSGWGWAVLVWEEGRKAEGWVSFCVVPGPDEEGSKISPALKGETLCVRMRVGGFDQRE